MEAMLWSALAFQHPQRFSIHPDGVVTYGRENPFWETGRHFEKGEQSE